MTKVNVGGSTVPKVASGEEFNIDYDDDDELQMSLDDELA